MRYQNARSITWRNVVTNIDNITETAMEFGREAKESLEKLARSAEKLARSASDSLDETRDGTGDALHAAAASIREAGQSLNNLTTGVSQKLHATGAYIEDHDFKGMLKGFASRNPGPSLVVAAALGFFIGTAVMRRTR
jgi:ElaB/YqjD/DUF883 family membrane-anchored ribosome-binding protein